TGRHPPGRTNWTSSAPETTCSAEAAALRLRRCGCGAEAAALRLRRCGCGAEAAALTLVRGAPEDRLARREGKATSHVRRTRRRGVDRPVDPVPHPVPATTAGPSAARAAADPAALPPPRHHRRPGLAGQRGVA